jgi:oligopeptide/dipeptide ABC transporter ATP-binding protein
MASLTIRGLHKYYGKVHALRGIDLDIADGEFCVFVGPSGCGKTTLLRIIAGLETIGAGELSIGGRRVNELAPAERRIAMVFQSYALYPHMTVYRNIAFGLKFSGGRKAEVDAKVRRTAEILHLTPLLNRKPRELSGGQRQRVAIARALTVQPRLLVLDEPTSAIDVKAQARILALIGDLRSRRNLAYLLITHNLGIVSELCEQTAVLYLGRVVESGPTGELLSVPAHPYTQALRSAVPEIDMAARRTRLVLPGEPPDAASPPPGCVFHPRCPLAIDRCATEVPTLREVRPGRQAACHRAEEVLAGVKTGVRRSPG